MVIKTNNFTVPLIYAYLYMKIKKQMRGGRITGSNLRKIIQKIIICEKDGGTKGIPKRYRYDIIKDMISLNLIERVGMTHKDYIYEDNDENIIEVVERLKEWKISKKLRNNKKVKEKLNIALNALDKDPIYRVVKSQCDKQLKQSFWP